MKIVTIAAAIVSIGVASAAPAIVWKNGENSSGPSHVSEKIDARSFFTTSIGDRDSSALTAVVFLIGRDADGSEGLSKLASSGKLPGVQGKYSIADSIHHHVDGVESSRTIARDTRKSLDSKVVEVTLNEFNRKLSSIAQNTVEESPKSNSKAQQKRRRDISEADVLIVSTGPNDDSSAVDSSVVAAIESPSVKNVILSSVRSVDEVMRARKLAVVDRFTKSQVQQSSPTRRRLEDEANNENQNNQNNQGDDEVVYYVNLTPNIFAGLLFFFMFAFTAHLGLSCMNMIEGQDVYVKKMPYIGREV